MDIITANLGNPAHNVTWVQQRAALARYARSKPAVIVTQEANNRLIVPRGYRAMPEVGGGAEQVRIIVDKRRTVLGHGYVRMHPGQAGSWPARWLPFVVVERGGVRPPLWVVGVHLNSAIEAGGHFVAQGSRKVFTRHHIETLADFGRFVDRSMHEDVLILGDFNVDAYADRRVRERAFPSRQMEANGLVEALPATRSGTHGKRRIDRVFHTKGLRVSVRDMARRAPYDHQPVRVTVT